MSPSKNERFAYIKSATPTVRAIFYSVGTPDPTQDLQIRGVAQNVTPTDGFAAYTGWSLGYTTVHFPTGSSYSSETGFAVSPGTHVPTSVGKWKSKFSWQITGVGGGYYMQYLSNTTHDYYTVFDTPESPMTEPWTEVLDYSCDWASGATSKQNAATSITSALYDSGFTYNSSDGGSMYGDPFSLTTFLADIGTYNYVNCFDMARAVVCVSNSIGCNLSVIRLGKRYDGQNPLNYPVNCVDPIGTHDPLNGTPPGPTNNPFPVVNQIYADCRTLLDGGFKYHAYAVDTNGYVWDATLKYDTGSDPDHVTGSNPGCGTISYPTPTWTLPANVLESTYRSNLLDSFPEWSATSPTRQSILFNIQ